MIGAGINDVEGTMRTRIGWGVAVAIVVVGIASAIAQSGPAEGSYALSDKLDLWDQDTLSGRSVEVRVFSGQGLHMSDQYKRPFLVGWLVSVGEDSLHFYASDPLESGDFHIPFSAIQRIAIHPDATDPADGGQVYVWLVGN
jgi:hypothetical protein